MNQFIHISSQIILSCMLLTSTAICSAFAAPQSIAPVLDVQVETKKKQTQKPSWMNIWNEAREQARANEFEFAKQSYLHLFNLKPNIIEARWEYCKLLIFLKEFDIASLALEGLIELDTNNLEYLIAAGGVELKTKRFKMAAQYFGQVYEENPGGKYFADAIRGLIDAFKGLDKIQGAYLLMEQLYHLDKNNQKLLSELAALSQSLGYLEKSRNYYSSLVDNFNVDSATVLNASLTHDYPGYKDKAAIYWKKYLNYDENFLPVHKKLAQYYIDKKKIDLAVLHLAKIYTLEDLSADLALRIGKIYYKDMTRPDKGLFYYEQYAKAFPDDREVNRTINEIRKKLAREYLPIVENDNTLRLWNDLDHVTINKEFLFLEMADLLREDKKTIQETALVRVLYEADDKNTEIGIRLARLLYVLQDYNSTYLLISKLGKEVYLDDQLLLIKADVEQNIGEERKGLVTLLQYLKKYKGNTVIHQNAIELAGKLGLVKELKEIWEIVVTAQHVIGDKIETGFVYIEALRSNGLFSTCESIYEKLQQEAQGNQQLIAKIKFHMADSLQLQGLIFEAEQIVRQVLAKNIAVKEALEKLILLSIRQEQLSLAKSWLYLLAARYDVYDLNDENVELPAKLFFLDIKLLLAEGEYDEAEEKLLAQHRDGPSTRGGRPKTFMEKRDFYLASLYLYSGELGSSQRMVENLLNQLPGNIELLVMKEIVDQALSSLEGGIDLKEKKEKEKFSSLVEKSKYFLKYDKPYNALESVKAAQEYISDSMVTTLLEIEILTSLTQYTKALEMVSNVLNIYPEQAYFARLLLQLEYKSGNFDQIVKSIPRKENKKISHSKPHQQESLDLFFQERLLLARSLWAKNRRREAIEVYDSLLAIPVDTVFLEKIEVENVNFHLPPLKKSFWNIITFTNPAKPDPITAVMDPQFFTKNIGQPVDDIAASLYGKYRWQKLIKKELAARQAVEKKDFYTAEKEYLSLIKEEKSEETLFDLAGIYNRLEQYGKEAEIYELMKENGPLYPGLDEYIKANSLKRQPRISTNFFTSKRQGRDGHINLKKRFFGFEGWIMPTLDQEVSLSLFRNFYSSIDNLSKSDSNRFIGTYSTYFEDKFDLNISAGSDNPTDSGTTEILIKFEMIGRFSDLIEGYGRFEQDLVEDTMDSITESIIYRDLDAGLKLDLFPRWFMGADYRYRIYSDDNKQNRYKLWSMYHLFGEMNQFSLKYSYENIRSSSKEDGIDRAYWSPNHYWQHYFTVHLKHLFAKEYIPESSLSYVTMEYSYGYESNFNHNHAFDINIFLEINRHLLLKGNFVNINGEDYKETEAVMSLIYRW